MEISKIDLVIFTRRVKRYLENNRGSTFDEAFDHAVLKCDHDLDTIRTVETLEYIENHRDGFKSELKEYLQTHNMEEARRKIKIILEKEREDSSFGKL